MPRRPFSIRDILPSPPEHRSPGWRERSAALLLGLVIAGTCGYWYLTSEARLTGIVQSFLENLTSGQVQIRQVDFSFFDGIEVADLAVLTPPDAEFGPADNDARTVFRAASVHLQHDPISLLLGRFRVERIVAVQPEFRFVTDRATGRSNWQSLLARPQAGEGGQSMPRPLPRVELKDCVLRTGLLDGEDLALAEPLRLNLAAMPDPATNVYICRLRARGEDRRVSTVRIDLDNGAVAGDLPGIRIAQFQLSLPAAYARWCEILELAGQIDADSIDYSPQQTRCTISLANVTLSVPFDEAEFYGQQQRARRLVRLEAVSGRIVFEPEKVQVDLDGQLNGRPVQVRGTMTNYTGPLAEMGYDLHIETGQLPVPDRNDPYVVAQLARLGSGVDRIFTLFDPTAGSVSLRGSLVRPPGPDGRTRFRGVVETFDATGRFKDFPYRGNHARSTIRFTDDGVFFDVFARRGLAAFRIKGWVAGTWRDTDADVTVEAVSVPLDDRMYRALPEKFQGLWDHFDFLGLVSCKFHLRRMGGTPDVVSAPWTWDMHLTLHNVAARYRPFNYTQWGLNGSIEAADGRISRIDLQAVGAGAVTRVLGTADLRDNQTAVDLRILTKNRRATPDVMTALPERVRRLVGDWSIDGVFDVDADVTLSEETGRKVVCRALIDWRNGTTRPAPLPYALSDVQGQLYLDLAAQRLEVRRLTGRNGSAAVRVAGQVDLGDPLSGQLDVQADDLPFDEQLYAALPGSLQHWWQALKPQGEVGVQARLDFTESPAGMDLKHRTSLTLDGNQACYQAFPLPLEDVAGQVVVTPGRCELRDVSGRHGAGQLRLGGEIEWDEAATSARLHLVGRDVEIDEPLRLAVPWQVRRLWNRWQPAGRMDVDVSSLRYSKPADGLPTWDIEGSLAGNIETIDLAMGVTDATVRTSLDLHIDQQKETFEGSGQLQGERATIASIPVQDATAGWERLADGTFRLRDLAGRALGGDLAGYFEMGPSVRGDQYGVVLSLDHADPGKLTELLTGGQMGGISGHMQAQMRLRGLADQPDQRTGGAEVELVGQGLYRLPVLLQIANLLNIPVLGEPENAQHLTAKITIMGDRALLDSLELRDNRMLMMGNGVLQIPTRETDLTVVAARPRAWPEVPVLTELFEGALRELIEVRGTGPINDLKFEARPLRSIRAAIETLAGQRDGKDR